MTTKPNPHTLFVYDARENVVLSWLRDSVSFAILCGAAWFVNTQMPPSGWINATVCILWMIWMVGKGQKRKVMKTPDEARQWLDDNFPTGAAA